MEVMNPRKAMVGQPATRSLSLATAYQATDPTRPAVISITLTSTATLNIGGGQTHSAEVAIGSTNGVATSGGSVMGAYSNALTGTVVIGVGINSVQTITYAVMLPANWFFAVRQTAGSVTIARAFEQEIT